MVSKGSLGNNQWEISNLEEVVEILDGMRKPIKKADRVTGGIPYYGATGIIDWVKDYIFDEPLILVGEDGENLRSRVLPMAFKIQGKAWVNNHAHVLRPYKNVDIDYLTYYLDSISYEDYITGSAQPKLNQNQLKKIKVLLPHVREQQKIVLILSSVDEAIKKTQAIIEQIVKVKKGFMKQLFTEGIGHTKFKKTKVGEIPEKWELKTIKDLLSDPIRDFGSFSTTKLIKYVDSGVAFLRSDMFLDDGTLDFNSVQYITEEVDKHLTKSYVEKGNVLFTKIGVNLGDSVVYEGEFGRCNSNAAIAKISIDENLASKYYISYFLNSQFCKKQYLPSVISIPPRLNLGDIQKITVPLPSLAEQKKIVLILNSIQEKYQKERECLLQLEELKKGLMQSLLTGKIRVKVDEAEVTQV